MTYSHTKYSTAPDRRARAGAAAAEVRMDPAIESSGSPPNRIQAMVAFWLKLRVYVVTAPQLTGMTQRHEFRGGCVTYI